MLGGPKPVTVLAEWRRRRKRALAQYSTYIHIADNIAGVHSTVQMLSAALFQGGGRPNLSGLLGHGRRRAKRRRQAQGTTKCKLYLTTQPVAALETEHGSR